MMGTISYNAWKSTRLWLLREMRSHFRVFSNRLTPPELRFGRIAQAALRSTDYKDTQIRSRTACYEAIIRTEMRC